MPWEIGERWKKGRKGDGCLGFLDLGFLMSWVLKSGSFTVSPSPRDPSELAVHNPPGFSSGCTTIIPSCITPSFESYKTHLNL
jgi:hypothetical protein